LAAVELLARVARNLDPWRPRGVGVALTLDLLRVGDELVDLAGETDELPPELGGILRRRGGRSRLARQPLFDQPAHRFGTRRPRALPGNRRIHGGKSRSTEDSRP
jgi:hypothetical protein